MSQDERRLTRHVVIPAVYLVLMQDDQLLMLRRANTGYMDGWYGLVSGHLEGEETLTEAIAREALEEVGAVLDLAHLRLAHVMHTPPEPSDRNRLERIDFYFLYFLQRNFRDLLSNREPNKCDDIAWVDVATLPSNTVPRVRIALDAIARQTLLSEAGWQSTRAEKS